MKKILACIPVLAFAIAACCASASAQERQPLLVTPAWVHEHLSDPNLVLLQFGAKGDFGKEHIPGAQYISLADISVPDMSQPHEMGSGHLMLELPPIEKLTASLENHGISNDSRIVVYVGKSSDSYSASTRIVWTLNYYGLGDRTSLLDGGLPAWRTAGYPITSEVKTPAPGKLTPNLHPEIFADAAYVLAHLNQSGISLIDARQPQNFSGSEESRMSRAGHIPGALNLPIEILLDDKNHLKDSPALADLFRSAGYKQGNQIVTYCYIGQRATLVWFAAKLLGYNARLYDGSWEEWSSRNDLPVEKSKDR